MYFSVFAFIIWRLLTLFVSYVAQRTIPYLGFFPYGEILEGFHLPSWLTGFANFDGLHYLRIATDGYSQYEQAFFPLYPLLIKLISYFFRGNMFAAAFVLSSVSFLIGLTLFFKLASKFQKKENTPWTLLFLLLFPTAFYFGALYTEGLFFLLVIASLYFLQEKKYIYVCIFSFLASTTRLIGVFLIVPFFFSLITSKEELVKKLNFKSVALLLSPCIGLLTYVGYLWISTGDPLIFFNAQPKFGANRSTHLILLPQVYYRYFKIIFTAAHNFQWVMSLVEMCFFSIVFVVLILDLFSIMKMKRNENKAFFLGLNLFSLINVLLPTLTGTFSSIPRYALFSLSFFFYLGGIKSKMIKSVIALLFLTGQIILLSLFVQGYFVG